MRYVIVEDEVRIREGIQKLLMKLDKNNIVVGEAENGEEGLEVIRRIKPDIVITDIKMPTMDGLQMLEIIHAEKLNVKAIVLSAYSEFEYARTAMKLGVTEYLLKPIALNEFTLAIEHLKEQINHARLVKPQQIGNLEQVIKGILNGDIEVEKEVLDYLANSYGITELQNVSILTIYSQDWNEILYCRIQAYLEKILLERPNIKYCFLENREQKSLQLFLYGYTNADKVERWFQVHFLQDRDVVRDFAMGWTQSKGIMELKSAYEGMNLYLDWNIALGDDILISYPKIKQIQTTLCIYPIKLESEMRTAVCSLNNDKIEATVKRYLNYFQSGSVYEPAKIKECHVRYFWAMINLAREIGLEAFQNLEQQALLEKIMRARTTKELYKITVDLIGRFEKSEKDNIDNISIKRMLSMIHEFYQEGITLEEIAEKVDMTPEYLGTLFRKEMGVNFSLYIKNYRVSKAKELLIGTQLKLYEVARKTGFSDPKYFSKVFREVTGQLPADYRKLHK